MGGDKVKFGAVVGNPPYQISDGGAKASAKPIYQRFVMTAKSLNPEFFSLIVPTRWYVGGKGLNSFRDEMLSDVHLKELYDCLTPEDIFPNTNIRGGVCYFLWDQNYDNSKVLMRIVTYENDKIIADIVRPMKIGGIDIFIRDGKAVSILNKVFADGIRESMLNYVSPLRPFGFRGYFVKDDKFRSTNKGLSNHIRCYGKGKKVGYLERHEVMIRSEWIDLWKVFTPRANNIGTELNDDNLNTFIGEPGTICTESYIVIGHGLGLDEDLSNNLSKYLTTKFARYLHSLAKASQDATAKTYQFVPLQDFTSESDIDWAKSIDEIDEQLFNKYNLTEDERNHIKSTIKNM